MQTVSCKQVSNVTQCTASQMCANHRWTVTYCFEAPSATSLKSHIRTNREPTKMDAVLLLVMAASGQYFICFSRCLYSSFYILLWGQNCH